MREELEALGAALCRPAGPPESDTTDLDGEIRKAVVAIPAGGFGYRMRDVSAEVGGVTQKSLLPLPNGETLIDRVIRQYASVGFREFVALVNHAGQEVEAHVGDGSRWGVNVRYSYDTQTEGSGRTGAIL